MHDAKKSDPGVVPQGPGASAGPGKAANKGARVPAESVEGRTGIERNPGGRSTNHTQWWWAASQGAERMRQFIEREPQEKLTALLHHVTTDTLRLAYHGLKPGAAAGVDGMTWEKYGHGLEQRLLDLHRRVHTGAYRATPSRRVNIPKPDGGTRPLGVAALEDKIVQKAVVDNILTPIYEAEFLGFSYGFRPGRMMRSTRSRSGSNGARSTGYWTQTSRNSSTAATERSWLSRWRNGSGTSGCCDLSALGQEVRPRS